VTDPSKCVRSDCDEEGTELYDTETFFATIEGVYVTVGYFLCRGHYREHLDVHLAHA